jgi:tetratricopeptide (TPR) repeat protein
VNDATEYQAAGMEELAFEKYREAYVSNPSYVEAHIGLKSSGEKILRTRLNLVRNAVNHGNFREAKDLWENAIYFTEVASRYRVKLTIPTEFQQLEQQLHEKWILNLEDEAHQLLLDEKYESAQSKIAELKRLNPDNQKATYLSLLARIYPDYNKGMKAYELELYREAYFYFDEVVGIDADFKDALKLRDECLVKERFTLAYIPVHHEGVQTAFELSLAARSKQAILDLEDPFLVLLNRDNMEQLLSEQQKNMGAIFNEDQVIEAGNLIGAQFILTGEVVNYKVELTPKTVESKKGYAGSNRLSNKINYRETRQKLTVNIQFRFELMNAETGQVYLADNIGYHFSDEVHYADYDGNYLEVYAGDWKLPVLITPMDEIYNSPQEKHKLESLFEARKNLPSLGDMQQRALYKIAIELRDRLKGFNPR